MTENDTETPLIPKYPTGLKARGKRLWVEMHESGDFRQSPETVAVIEQACFLADEIKRLQGLIRMLTGTQSEDQGVVVGR